MSSTVAYSHLAAFLKGASVAADFSHANRRLLPWFACERVKGMFGERVFREPDLCYPVNLVVAVAVNTGSGKRSIRFGLLPRSFVPRMRSQRRYPSREISLYRRGWRPKKKKTKKKRSSQQGLGSSFL